MNDTEFQNKLDAFPTAQEARKIAEIQRPIRFVEYEKEELLGVIETAEEGMSKGSTYITAKNLSANVVDYLEKKKQYKVQVFNCGGSTTTYHISW